MLACAILSGCAVASLLPGLPRRQRSARRQQQKRLLWRPIWPCGHWLPLPFSAVVPYRRAISLRRYRALWQVGT